jgi:hypothetical protein
MGVCFSRQLQAQTRMRVWSCSRECATPRRCWPMLRRRTPLQRWRLSGGWDGQRTVQPNGASPAAVKGSGRDHVLARPRRGREAAPSCHLSRRSTATTATSLVSEILRFCSPAPNFGMTLRQWHRVIDSSSVYTKQPQVINYTRRSVSPNKTRLTSSTVDVDSNESSQNAGSDR